MSEGIRDLERLTNKMDKDKWIASALGRANDWPVPPINPFLKTKIEARLQDNSTSYSPILALRGALVAALLLINFSVLFFTYKSLNTPAPPNTKTIILFQYYSYE